MNIMNNKYTIIIIDLEYTISLLNKTHISIDLRYIVDLYRSKTCSYTSTVQMQCSPNIYTIHLCQ